MKTAAAKYSPGFIRPYEFSDGPDYPTGRRAGESVGDFIRRKQVEELRACGKGIFAPVPIHYSLAAEQNRRDAVMRRSLARPMPWRTEGYIQECYAAAMKAKCAAPPAGPIIDLQATERCEHTAPLQLAAPVAAVAKPAKVKARKRAVRKRKHIVIMGRGGPHRISIPAW
jgi:hypothetical protein